LLDPASDTDDANEEASPLDLDSIHRRERTKQRQTRESATGATPVDRITTPESSSELSNDLTSSSPAELEEEASSEGAFNPETGEINWDCPCLGGMAHGPCGEDFKAAFSCFVFSKEEPKGMDCIDNFKKMQDCFREHPDVYAGELADDEESGEGGDMADGLANERAELAKEVQERRRAMREKQAQSDAEVPQQRLLEESPAPPRPARKATAEATPEPSRTHSAVADVPPPASSEPHPGMSEEHKVADLERRETMSEGAPSQVVRKPSSPPMQEKVDEQIDKFDANADLTPKVWHDARDPDVPTGKKDKE
jgi:intermembrane space import and assembly protein 40